MRKKFFLFDLNKCVGCHACVVACTIENKTLPDTLWRDITSFNQLNYPEIPLFHFSLACNHCDNPPCLKSCPALAFTKDLSSGIVQHDANKCIGCKYCTWACPYDAPKFNERKKIIEKCTFCNHRLEDNLKPACANSCPTGALDFIDIPEDNDFKNIPGFMDYGIKPAIKIIAPHKDKISLIVSENQNIIMRKLEKKAYSKINLKHEWPLVIFTLIAMSLVAVFTASIFSDIKIEPYGFAGVGLVGMLLSSLHLGKKFRAWRSVLNIRNSWLSREILFFILFWILTFLYLFVYQDIIIAYIAIIAGIFSLVSIDKVYKLAIQPTKVEIHSAHVLLSYLLFTALFIEHYYALLFIVAIKTGLYIYRKIYFKNHYKNYRIMLSAWRLDMIISFPFLFWVFGIPDLFWWIALSLVIGEIIDRCEYYDELDIMTPKKQIEKEYLSKNE